jgi:hypothetical protein
MPSDSGGSEDRPAPGASGYDREFVGESFDLPPPRCGTVPDIAMEEDERRSGAGAFVGDVDPVNLDHLHGASPCDGSTVTFAQVPV